MDIGGGGFIGGGTVVGGGGYEPDFLQSSAYANPYGASSTSVPAYTSPAQPAIATPDYYPGYGGYGAVGGSWVPEAPTAAFVASAVPPASQMHFGQYPTPASPASAPARPAAAAKSVEKPKAPAQPAARTVAVKAGDSLTRIAQMAGVDWKQIYALNKDLIGSNPNVIRPGQVLKLP